MVAPVNNTVLYLEVAKRGDLECSHLTNMQTQGN